MSKPAQPPTAQRAATATPIGTPAATIYALLAASEAWEQGTEGGQRTQRTGVADKGR
jgi:hypothetical protein